MNTGDFMHIKNKSATTDLDYTDDEKVYFMS